MADTDWNAILQGAGNAATLGWNDEVAAKILASLPNDDGTGIPREYAGGGQEAQYRDEMRADNAAARERSPGQYLAGSLVGAAPLAIATSPLAGGAGAARIAASGLQGGAYGALQGAGESVAQGRGLARDAAVGAGVGGALGVALPAAAGLVKNARALALEGITAGEPALAGTGARAGARPDLGGAQIVRAMPPRPVNTIPPEAVAVPPPARVPVISDEAASLAEARLRQTEANWAKKHADRFNPQRGTIPARGRAQAR